MLKIYSEIIEYEHGSKIRPDKIKVQRDQIKKYLSKRYQPKFVAKIMCTFKFPNKCDFIEYC